MSITTVLGYTVWWHWATSMAVWPFQNFLIFPKGSHKFLPLHYCLISCVQSCLWGPQQVQS